MAAFGNTLPLIPSSAINKERKPAVLAKWKQAGCGREGTGFECFREELIQTNYY